MGRRIDSAGFAKLFTEFADSAFRMETLDEYREAQEQDAVRRFAAGEEPDDTWIADYVTMLRGFDADGKRLRRSPRGGTGRGSRCTRSGGCAR